MANKQTYWQTRLDAWRQSGLSQASYCKRHGLSLSSFGYWLHPGAKSPPPAVAVPIIVAIGHRTDGSAQRDGPFAGLCAPDNGS